VICRPRQQLLVVVVPDAFADPNPLPFSPETVARVEITSGTTALGPNDNPPSTNVVVLDDFAYSEPQGLPSPTLTVNSPSDGATVSAAQVTVAARSAILSGSSR
jgi:hypothetical protein